MNEKSAEELKQTAKQMVAPGKGILAADESLPTIEKRFKSINIENNEENRRVYREVIFTVPGIEEFISGVILFDETMHHKTSDDVGFVEFLKNKGIIPGIKVDEGTEAMPGTIRGDFSLSTQNTIIHASDSVETAKKEIGRFFTEEEIHEYEKAGSEMIYSDSEKK